MTKTTTGVVAGAACTAKTPIVDFEGGYCGGDADDLQHGRTLFTGAAIVYRH